MSFRNFSEHRMSFGCVAPLFAKHFGHAVAKDLGESFRCESEYKQKTFSLEVRYDLTLLKLCYGEEAESFSFKDKRAIVEGFSFFEHFSLASRSVFYIFAASLNFIEDFLKKGFGNYIAKVMSRQVDVRLFLAKSLVAVRSFSKVVICEDIVSYPPYTTVIEFLIEDNNEIFIIYDNGIGVKIEGNVYENVFLYLSWFIDDCSDLKFLAWKNATGGLIRPPALIGDISKHPFTRRLQAAIDDVRKKLPLPELTGYPILIRPEELNIESSHVICEFVLAGFEFNLRETEPGRFLYIFS